MVPTARRAEGHTYPDLIGPSRHGVPEHAVKAGRGEQQRQAVIGG